MIFARSQRDNDRAAVNRLIDIARREGDGELRRGALYWLGQSRAPRAARILSETIDP